MGVLVASTIAGLGSPTEDGAHGLLRTTHVELPMTWNLAHQVWLGRPAWTMRINDTVGGKCNGGTTAWKYPGAFAESPSPEVNPVSQNFRIHKILYAGELWAAGARLQEHLTAQMVQVNDVGNGDSELALAWYPLALGDDFLSPTSFNHGVRCVLSEDERDEVLNGIYRFCSSGWQNNVTTGDGLETIEDLGAFNTPPAIDEHFYPEIYQYGPSVSFRNFTALHRWAGGTGLGTGGSAEKPSKYPPADWVTGWYCAAHVTGADVGDPVSEVPDYSGRGRSLYHPNSTRWPVLTVDSSLGGKPFLRFDGTSDALGTNKGTRLSQAEGSVITPLDTLGIHTIYMVLRQRNSGGTQQVWLGPAGSGATLIYRGDNTNQVNIWRGGSDFTYHRAANWSQPMPWTIWSMACYGADTSVWENDVEVASGTAGGGTGFQGLVLGNNDGESLPAAIDVAELIVCIGQHGSTMRNAMVDYLNAKYSIF